LKLIIFFTVFFSAFSLAADIHCSHCKKKISGQYLMSSSKKPYCSKTCFSSTLPRCSVCKRNITGNYKRAGNKAFCSAKCYSTILPKCSLCVSPITKSFKIDGSHYCTNCIKRDRCFACNHPFVKGFTIPDKRKYCKACSTKIIFNVASAERIYKKAAVIHEKLMGVKGVAIPPLKFVDMKTMTGTSDHAHHGGMSLRGYYREIKLETETVDQNDRVVGRSVKKTGEFIYLLNGLEEDSILVTAIHELTHDWLSDYYPGIKVADLWIEEGFCQYVSYVYCSQLKLAKYKSKIEGATDEVYGKGFKFYFKKFGANNIKGALKWMVEQKYHIKPPLGAKRKN